MRSHRRHCSPAMQGEIEERSKFIDGLVEAAEKEERDLTEQEMELLARDARPDRRAQRRRSGRCSDAAEIASDSRERTAEIAQRVRRGPQPGRRPGRSSTARPAPTCSTTGGPASAPTRPASGSTCSTAPPRTRRPATTPACCRSRCCGRCINWVDAVAAAGQRARPARPAVRVVVPAEDQPAHRRRPAGRREDGARQPQDDHRDGAGHGHHLRRLRQRVPPEHRLVAAADHGHRHQRPGRRLRAGDRAGAVRGDRRGDHGRAGDPDRPGDPGGRQRRDLDGGRRGLRRDQGRRPGHHRRARPTCSGCSGRCSRPSTRTNASAPGFSAADIGAGARSAAISGLPVVVSAGFDAGTMIVLSTAAVEVYEDRIGVAAGRRAVGARRAGRLRGLLRAARDRAGGHRRDHEDGMSDATKQEARSRRPYDAPNQEVVRRRQSGPGRRGRAAASAGEAERPSREPTHRRPNRQPEPERRHRTPETAPKRRGARTPKAEIGRPSSRR